MAIEMKKLSAVDQVSVFDTLNDTDSLNFIMNHNQKIKQMDAAETFNGFFEMVSNKFGDFYDDLANSPQIEEVNDQTNVIVAQNGQLSSLPVTALNGAGDGSNAFIVDNARMRTGSSGNIPAELVEGDNAINAFTALIAGKQVYVTPAGEGQPGKYSAITYFEIHSPISDYVDIHCYGFKDVYMYTVETNNASETFHNHRFDLDLLTILRVPASLISDTNLTVLPQAE